MKLATDTRSEKQTNLLLKMKLMLISGKNSDYDYQMSEKYSLLTQMSDET